MGIKGHAIFELTNTKTGEKRVYEDDNMVTNFLEQFCIPTGPLNYNIMAMLASYANQKTNSQLSNASLSEDMPYCFTQGLLLFESEIDEDADNIWPRNGNKMVGQAGNVSYSGNNTLAGSYNEPESGAVENGYRYVWDFTTSQANGQISCACLTTPWGGKLGTGNKEWFSDYVDTTYPFLTSRSQYSTSYQTGLMTEGPPVLIDYDKDCCYQLKGVCMCGNGSNSYSEDFWEANSCFIKKEIRIRREKIFLNELSIFEKNLKTSVASDFEDLVFPMPKEIIDSVTNYDALFTKANMNKNTNFNVNTSINSWGKHIYIYFAIGANTGNLTSQKVIAPNDDLIIIDIDTEAETCNTFTVKNTTGANLKSYSPRDAWSKFLWTQGLSGDAGYCTTYPIYASPIFITDKYVVMHMEDGKIYRISRKDNTDVKAFTFEDGEEANFGAQYNNRAYRFSFLPLGKNAEQFNKNKVVGQCKTSNYPMYMFDFENATVGRVSKLNNDSDIYETTKILGTDLFALRTITSISISLSGGTLPIFLSTINNLDMPVVKTSADTMKVTYIITNGDA